MARDIVAAGRLGAPPEGDRVRVIDLDARVGNVSLGLEDLWTLAGAAFGARHLELVEAAATIQSPPLSALFAPLLQAVFA